MGEKLVENCWKFVGNLFKKRNWRHKLTKIGLKIGEKLAENWQKIGGNWLIRNEENGGIN